MLGYVLSKRNGIFKNNYSYPIVITAIAIITTLFRINVSQIYALDPYRAFFSPTVFFMSILMFDWFKKIQVRDMPFLRFLSNKTYYVYLLHSIVIYILLRASEYFSINPIIKIICISVTGFLISLVLSIIWDILRREIDRKLNIKQKITGW